MYHIWYIPEDQYAPECTMNLRDKIKVINNYEALTEDDKETVEDESYRRMKASVDRKYDAHTSTGAKK